MILFLERFSWRFICFREYQLNSVYGILVLNHHVLLKHLWPNSIMNTYIYIYICIYVLIEAQSLILCNWNVYVFMLSGMFSSSINALNLDLYLIQTLVVSITAGHWEWTDTALKYPGFCHMYMYSFPISLSIFNLVAFGNHWLRQWLAAWWSTNYLYQCLFTFKYIFCNFTGNSW